MPHNEDNKGTVIPVDLIRETVMAPYEYQKPQNGFGSTGVSQSHDVKKPGQKVGKKYKPRKSK